MYHVTPAEAEELIASHRRALSRVDAIQRKENTFKELAFQAGEVAIGATAFGILRGCGRGEIKSVPLDLAAGIALHAVAFSFGTKKASAHIHNLADGAMSTFFAMLGMNLGNKIMSSKTATSGDVEVPLMLGHGQPKSDARAAFGSRAPVPDSVNGTAAHSFVSVTARSGAQRGWQDS